MTGLSRGVVAAVAAVAVVSSSCSSRTTAAPAASPAAPLAATGTQGTTGDVIFATDKVGWVIAPHAARGVTDIYRTTDGGLTWALWGSLPEVAAGREMPGTAVVAGESALLLVPAGSDHVMFGADGGKWERRNFPSVPPNVSVMVEFLPDLRHGWLLRDNYGDFFQTVDGGRTWKVLTSFRQFENPGASGPLFWSPTDGSMYYNGGDGIVFLVTRDSGATWGRVDLPVVKAQQDLHVSAALALSPDLAMFNEADGLLALYPYPSSGPFDPAIRKVLYVTATSDGAAHWSPAKLIRLPEPGGVVFLDSQRWLMAGDRSEYFTRDAGGHWQQAAGLDAGLWRGRPGLHVTQSNRNIAFLTFSAGNIHWLDVSTDGGEHWRPVPLPDVREAS
jgi:photosystem II stability/assembly factor-like uncharacterized protein